MKIEKIKKMNSGKYKIVFENGETILTYDDAILKHSLLFHKEIEESEKEALLKDTTYYDFYNKLVKKISLKLRSEREINKELDKMGATEKEKVSLIKKLKENGLLNDQAFAKAYVSDRTYLSKEGPYKIRKGLEEHQLNEDIIEKALQEIDESIYEEKLKKSLNKKIELNHKYSPSFLKQKLVQEFSNLGYPKEMILKIYEDSTTNSKEILEKEGTKLLKKYSSKYQDSDLERKVKEKLYQKGFSLSDINKFLQKK